MRGLIYICALALLGTLSCGKEGSEDVVAPDEGGNETPDMTGVPTPDPDSRSLYNGIELPASWPVYRSTSSIYDGMSPFYLTDKPSLVDISLGRQLFVDDFLIASTSLSRVWHKAEYYEGNPVLAPETDWEIYSSGGGSAAPFSDGVWYDEVDGKFKMWYMGGGASYGEGYSVTCYAESSDGLSWTRPSLNVVPGTNIVHRGKERDSSTVWIDKTGTDASARYKMFNVYGGAGNWQYHYLTSSDGKAWREKNSSGSVADRSTVFHNPFRGVWVWSMRHNVRMDASTLVRGRDYMENASAAEGNKAAEADILDFWVGPWPDDPVHPDYPDVQPAIYNLDAIGYESIMLGLFSVWSGPENDVCSSDHVIKRNQILLGYSRDGWNWYREDFDPFCPVSESSSQWNWGNIQSAAGSPLIVGDELYFYMSGRKFDALGNEVMSTGLATLRRDGFASMSGTGELLTEPLKFTGSYFYVNADCRGSLKVELLDESGNVLEGFSAQECVPLKEDGVSQRVSWTSGSSLENQEIRVRFIADDCDLYAFWISQFEDGRSYGYTAGGGPGLNKYGIDL